MRVWFRKIHCPSFICFLCKPPQNLCTPPAPDTNHNNRSTPADDDDSDHLCIEKKEEGDESKTTSCSTESILKSSLKRKAVEEGTKKSVKWMDVAGKELVQVKEFEISESEDTDSDGDYNRGCICPII